MRRLENQLLDIGEAGFFKKRNILHVKDGVARVHGGLVLGRLTDQALILGEGYERRRGKTTLLVGDDLDIGALVRGNAGVGGA